MPSAADWSHMLEHGQSWPTSEDEAEVHAAKGQTAVIAVNEQKVCREDRIIKNKHNKS